MPDRRQTLVAAFVALLVAAAFSIAHFLVTHPASTTSSSATTSGTTTQSGGAAQTGTNASGMTQAQIQALVNGTRLINYFPATHVSQAMWDQWDPTLINNDFAKLAALGANTTRLILYPKTFGYPTPSAKLASELSQAISMAAAHHLKVVLSLFNGEFSYTDLAGSEQWAKAILAPYRGNSEISYVELQGEIDPTKVAAMTWASTMLPIVRSDAGRPISLSVTCWDSPLNLGYLIKSLTTQPDIYDYHFYGPAQDALPIFTVLKRWVSGAPLIIGETGYSSEATNSSVAGVGPTAAAHEAYQASFFQTVENAARTVGLPPAAPWVLQDYAATQYISPTEKHFGLLRLDGTAKPAAAVIKSVFAAAGSGSTGTSATQTTTSTASTPIHRARMLAAMRSRSSATGRSGHRRAHRTRKHVAHRRRGRHSAPRHATT